MLIKRLPEIKTHQLRRLARYLRIKHWYRLRRIELIDEIAWKLDPYK
jgi:hypothetical protein